MGDDVAGARLKSFINHIHDTYNIEGSSRNWSLIRILNNGIGVHHGALPRYIQREVLKQFNDGNLKFLFCTSTIIEGVNTDAKNTVILNSSKGNIKLTAFDIKNIGGRAGRYYHNFVGRIYYTDRKLIEILDSGSNSLNFITFDDKELENIDLDNADLLDLSGININLKQERIRIQNDYQLPRKIFEKNRLVSY